MGVLSTKLGEVMKRLIMSKIVDPLPILPAKHRNQELIGNLPKFGSEEINSDLAHMNGRPKNHLVFDE
jgi:hypothetical protein